MKTPSDIVWDWNGTLLDDVAASVAAFNTLLRERGLPETGVGPYRESFSFPVRPLYAKHGFDLAREDWDALAARFHSLLMSDPGRRPADSAIPALRLAAAGGARQWALSALRQDLLEADIAKFGMEGFFDGVYGSDNLDGAAKSAQAARLARDLAGSDTAVVGDTSQDADTARACGMRCVLVSCGHQSAARLAPCGFPVVPDPLAAVRLLGF